MKTKLSALASLLIVLGANADAVDEYRVVRASPNADGVEEPTLLFIDVNGQRILVTREVLSEIIDYQTGEHVELEGDITVRVHDRVDEIVVINNDRVVLNTNIRDLTNTAHNSRGFAITE